MHHRSHPDQQIGQTFIEGLEERRLLSVSLHDGLLRVAGRVSSDDRVMVFLNKRDHSKIDVKLNNVVTEYSLASILL